MSNNDGLKRHLAPYLKPKENEDRKRALKHVGVGAAIVGTATGAEALLDRRLKRKGVPGPVKAAVKGQFKPKAHLPHLAGRVGTRSLAAAGVPVAAYGLWNIANPKGKVEDLDVKRDVLRPVIDAATLRDQRDKLSSLRKSLTASEENLLVRRKERGTKISHVAGAMGVGALALRSPQGAKTLIARSKKAGSLKSLRSLAAKEKPATSASNTLGVASIGTGSIGSFNYAAQQKLEAKQVKKNLGEAVLRNAKVGRVRVLSSPKKDYFDVLDSRDQRRFVHRSNLEFVKPKGGKAKPAVVDKPGPQTEQLELFKADKFLREYGDRISPKAEDGYKHLKRGRDRRAVHAAAGGTLAGISAGFAAGAARAKRPGWAALHSGLAAVNGASAVSNAKGAAAWDKRLKKIKAKAYERAAAGEYGKGRLVAKADKKSDDQKKALAAGAVAGGAAVAMAPLPTSLPGNRKTGDRIMRQLGNNTRGYVNVKDVRGAATGAGERFASQQHQDRLSARMMREGFDERRPIKVARTPDGNMRIRDGHHRVQSALDLGMEKVPVQMEHVGRKHRSFVPLAMRAKYQRDVLRAREATPPRPKADILRNAEKPISRAAVFGNNVRSRGERVALQLRKPASLAGLAGATGAATGGLLMHRAQDRKKRVAKAFPMPRTPGVPKLPRPTSGWLKPKLSAPKIRQSYVGTSPTGKKFTVRGTVR